MNPAIRDKKMYVRVWHVPNGGSFIDTLERANDFLKDADEPDAYRMELVWLTPDEFEALPEFQGF